MLTLLIFCQHSNEYSITAWTFSLILQLHCCWSIHLKSLLMFKAVYYSLFQISTLSDCKTCIVWSFAFNSWISDFFSHCYHWFHTRAAQDQYRFKYHDDNHLQVLQEDRIHFWQEDLNSCWMSKDLFCSYHWLKYSDCMNWR